MDQDNVALLHPVGLAQQILRGEALEHHARAGFVGDRARQLEQKPGFDISLLGVGPGRAAIGDAIAGLEPRDRRSDLDDFAGAFGTRRVRHLRGRIETGAVVDVDEVDPDRVLPQPDLALARRRELDLLELHDFRTAGLMDAYRAHLFPLIA